MYKGLTMMHMSLARLSFFILYLILQGFVNRKSLINPQRSFSIPVLRLSPVSNLNVRLNDELEHIFNFANSICRKSMR